MTDKPPETPPNAWDTEFKPYALAIGFLVREWNNLQERLCDLFSTVLVTESGLHRLPIEREVAERLGRHSEAVRAVWYAVQSDRLQRRLLKDATEQMYPGAIFDEVKWLVNNSDATGSQRDDAVHSPVSMAIADPIEFIALHFHGHPRAKTLKGRKLLDEFKSYTERAAILARYASTLDQYIMAYRRSPDSPPPLPKRPFLPDAPGKTPKATLPRTSPTI